MKKNKEANLKAFGEFLYEKRMRKRIGLREICKMIKFDPSNWSKIERGKLSPPSDRETLSLWAEALGMKENSEDYHFFIEYAAIAQGIIPDTLSDEGMLKLLPAFFRTIRNGKPTKKELDDLVKIIKASS